MHEGLLSIPCNCVNQHGGQKDTFNIIDANVVYLSDNHNSLVLRYYFHF